MGTALLALACGVALAACREPAAPPPRADDGSLRLVSLSPSISEIVVALGARDQLVAVDEYSHRLKGLGDLPSLGGLYALDRERLLELRPTLVLGTDSEQQRDLFGWLERRGIAAELINSTGGLDQVLGTYARIGALLGDPARGEALAARVREQLDAIEESVNGLTRPRVAVVLNPDPLYVAGSAGYVHALIEIAGGQNVFADLKSSYPQVALEVLAERRPDVLLDASADTDAARARWRRFDWIGRVEALPHGVATRPGADLARGARLLRARLHPEHFRAEPDAS